MFAKVMALAVVAFGALQAGNAGEVRTLAKGSRSGIARAENRVVRTAAEWQRLWNEHTAGTEPRPPLPAVDFEREMVLAVFMGEQRTGGYAVQITGLRKDGSGVVALVRKTTPRPGGISIQALTQPFFLAAMPKSEGKVTFAEAK